MFALWMIVVLSFSSSSPIVVWVSCAFWLVFLSFLLVFLVPSCRFYARCVFIPRMMAGYCSLQDWFLDLCQLSCGKSAWRKWRDTWNCGANSAVDRVIDQPLLSRDWYRSHSRSAQSWKFGGLDMENAWFRTPSNNLDCATARQQQEMRSPCRISADNDAYSAPVSPLLRIEPHCTYWSYCYPEVLNNHTRYLTKQRIGLCYYCSDSIEFGYLLPVRLRGLSHTIVFNHGVVRGWP